MNLEQLNAMTDLELDEAVALAHGWDEVPHGRDEKVWDTGTGDFIYNYHPTQDTTEGKSAAFDLMVKYQLHVDCWEEEESDIWLHHDNGDCTKISNDIPQRAIVIAAILSAQEK